MYLHESGLHSLSTLSNREQAKVKSIVDRNLPFLAKIAKKELRIKHNKSPRYKNKTNYN